MVAFMVKVCTDADEVDDGLASDKKVYRHGTYIVLRRPYIRVSGSGSFHSYLCPWRYWPCQHTFLSAHTLLFVGNVNTADPQS